MWLSFGAENEPVQIHPVFETLFPEGNSCICCMNQWIRLLEQSIVHHHTNPMTGIATADPKTVSDFQNNKDEICGC